MKFRKAKQDDKEEILALYQSLIGTPYCAWGNGYPGEQEFDYDMSRNALFVWKMKMEKSLARSQWMKIRRWKHSPAGPNTAAVCGAFQTRGTHRYAESGNCPEASAAWHGRIEKQGKKSVHFLVCKTNKKALRSYEKLHFDVVGESGLFDEDWWCYEKEL